MKPYHLITCLLLCFMAVAPLALAEDSPADHTKTIKDQQLTGMVTGVRGMVQIRLRDDAPWQKAKTGMKLTQGAEFRTGPRSAVQFKIPPDQTITLDRLGTIKLLTAIAKNNKITTDLGMTYGRTRYDIRKAGFEHESTIRSPSATLSVRGTRVGIQDGASGFIAWSTQSRAYLFDQLRHKNFTFGQDTGVQDTGTDPHAKGPAQDRLAKSHIDPGNPKEREGDENRFLLTRPGLNPNPNGANSIFGPNRQRSPKNRAPFDVNTFTSQYGIGDLEIALTWGSIDDTNNYADLNLSVLDPQNYSGGISTNPGAVPFPKATLGDPGQTQGPKSGPYAAVNTNLGDNGDDATTSYDNRTAKEAIIFHNGFPRFHAIGVTNSYSSSPNQSYTVTLTKSTSGSSVELGQFSDSVPLGKTKVHSVLITPHDSIIVAKNPLIITQK